MMLSIVSHLTMQQLFPVWQSCIFERFLPAFVLHHQSNPSSQWTFKVFLWRKIGLSLTGSNLIFIFQSELVNAGFKIKALWRSQFWEKAVTSHFPLPRRTRKITRSFFKAVIVSLTSFLSAHFKRGDTISLRNVTPGLGSSSLLRTKLP